jgi:hypothetical protein
VRASSKRAARAISEMSNPAELLEVLFEASKGGADAGAFVYFACKALSAVAERSFDLAPSREAQELRDAAAVFAERVASTVERSEVPE